MTELNPTTVPPGWKLVPIEPTDIMIEAMETPRDYRFVVDCGGYNSGISGDTCADIYRAMLAAAPEYESDI